MASTRDDLSSSFRKEHSRRRSTRHDQQEDRHRSRRSSFEGERQSGSSRHRYSRNRSDDYHDDDRRSRRRKKKRRRSYSSSRRPSAAERYHRRQRSPSSSSETDHRRSRKRRRRRRDDHRRHDSSSSSRPRPARAAQQPLVVSDDDSKMANASNKRHKTAQHENTRSSSSHDDTVGHFRGGPGVVIADRYRIVREVGIGTFGRVVECTDIRNRQGRFGSDRVAMKIVRNVKRYYESALIEADIIRDVNRRGGRGVSHCAIMYDAFSFCGGHYCLVFESLGLSLYDYLKQHKYQSFPMICIRDFSVQLLETLEFLHSFGLIHTDLKPENILLTKCPDVSHKGYKVPASTKIKVIDFGGATYDHEKKSSVINTRQYRAPEVILGVGWSMPSDLWSAGCILAELYQGDLLFATHDNVEHLGLIERVIGPFPRRMLQRAKSQIANQVFDSNGRHRMDRVLPQDNATYVQKAAPLESIIRRKDTHFLDLLRRLLVIDPDRRATARDCLRYRW